MRRQKKQLLIMTIDRSVNTFLRDTLHNIIGKEVNVLGICLDDDPSRVPEIDLVMTSGAHMLNVAKRSFPGKTILAPQRIITGYNLEKVLTLPRDSRVLVINNPRETTEETISSLRDLGITHLSYVPYWKGCNDALALSDIDAAISPAMGHIAPETVEPVIDIGPRLISIKSFSEILQILGLSLKYLEAYTNRYHYYLMESSRKLSEALAHAELLRKRGEIILNEFDDGVLSVNQHGRINLINRSARALLGRQRRSLVNETYDSVVRDFKKLADLIDEGEGNRSAEIYAHGGKQIVINKIPVVSGEAINHIYTFREISRIQRLEKDVRVKLAAKGHLSKYFFKDIWGTSEKLSKLIEKANRFAKTKKNILITGESGTGKELIAHAIHENSTRSGGPFVAVNFAGIPENLIESELFGYEEGAFTGAKKGGKTGLFEQAHGGTIFLDEIGDASFAVQSRLLRVLQEREVMKVGGSKIIPVDLRIIAATNANLRDSMEMGKFRQDLYYRLSTLPLEVPPLRERSGDILHIFSRYLTRHYTVRKSLSPEATTGLTSYSWPGNIRELTNAAEYAFISSQGEPHILLEHLPDIVIQNYHKQTTQQKESPPGDLRSLLSSLGLERLDRYIVYHLLNVLFERRGLVTGRATLCRVLRKRQILISEGRVKSALGILRKHDLIEVGSTKQGTTISELGERLLNELGASLFQ